MATVLITGANRGIGLAFVEHYLAAGDHVIAVCRNSSPELVNSGAFILEGIDISDPSSIQVLKEKLVGQPIDLLINNAGILHNESLAEMDFDRIITQLNVNAVAPVRVVHALQENMKDGGKIALMSSRMGSIADNGSGAYYGYRMSKTALNAAGMSLAHDLKARGLAVAILHPGMVSTAMTGHAGDVSPEQAVAGLVSRIEDLDLSNSGTFWHANGDVLPW